MRTGWMRAGLVFVVLNVVLSACVGSLSHTQLDAGPAEDVRAARDSADADAAAIALDVRQVRDVPQPEDTTPPDVARGADAAGSCAPAEGQLPDWANPPRVSRFVWVSPAGDDSRDGLSRETALRTTMAALRLFRPGTQINFTRGTHACGVWVDSFAGTREAPGVLKSIDGPRAARFDCARAGGFGFALSSFIVVDGLDIRDAAGHGVLLAGMASPPTASEDFVLINSHISNPELACLKTGQSRRVTVMHNECAHTNVNRQHFEFVVTDDVVLAFNEGHGGGAFNEIKGGARGGRIFGNYIHDTGGGILVGGDCTGFQFLLDNTVRFEASGLRVWNNVMLNVRDTAFRIVSCHDCTVSNNTFSANGGATLALMRVLNIGFGDSSGCSVAALTNQNVVVQNNIFASAMGYTYGIASNASPSQIVLRNNLFWAGDGAMVQTLGTDLPFRGEAASLYDVNPGFVSATDLHLAATSGARGRGRAEPFVTGDFEGACAPTPPNMGAY